jgi:hypothetical protein
MYMSMHEEIQPRFIIPDDILRMEFQSSHTEADPLLEAASTRVYTELGHSDATTADMVHEVYQELRRAVFTFQYTNDVAPETAHEQYPLIGEIFNRRINSIFNPDLGERDRNDSFDPDSGF